jgi:hypothetical protein
VRYESQLTKQKIRLSGRNDKALGKKNPTAKYNFRLAITIRPNGINNTNTNIEILYDVTLGVLTCHSTLHEISAPLLTHFLKGNYTKFY